MVSIEPPAPIVWGFGFLTLILGDMKIIFSGLELSRANIHRDYIVDRNEDYYQEIVGTLTINFVSGSDFSKFTKDDGALDEEKLFIEILNRMPKEIEL